MNLEEGDIFFVLNYIMKTIVEHIQGKRVLMIRFWQR